MTLAGIFLFLTLQAQSQPCTDDEQTRTIPGKLINAGSSPAGYVSDYSAAEKTVSLKALKAAEEICKKIFFGDGHLAKGNFSYSPGEYFSSTFLAGYQFTTGFYRLICKDGRATAAHEYGTDLKIVFNPVIHPGLRVSLHSPGDPGLAFSVKGTRKDRSTEIALFRYLVFTNKEELEKTNTGSGYIDSKPAHQDAYDKTPDVTRTWYITPAGKPLFVPVTRKEYLESLLEYYEREKTAETAYWDKLIRIDGETLRSYEKEKDGKYKKDYAYFQNRLTEYGKEKAKYQSNYETKKNIVSTLLNNQPESWLQEAAFLNPAIKSNNYGCDDLTAYNQTGNHTFYRFADGQSGLGVYKWNPVLFKQMAAGTPVFLKVALRYKSGVPESEAIRDHYTNHLDPASFRTLLSR